MTTDVDSSNSKSLAVDSLLAAAAPNLSDSGCLVSELTVSKLTCQRVGLSASCLVSALSRQRVDCQQVDVSASRFVSELSRQRVDCQRVGLSARCLSPLSAAAVPGTTSIPPFL